MSEVYRLTTWKSVFQKLIVAQMVKFVASFSLVYIIQFRVRKNPPFFPVLSQINPLRNLPVYLILIGYYAVYAEASEAAFPLLFPAKMYAFLILLMHAISFTHDVFMFSYANNSLHSFFVVLLPLWYAQMFTSTIFLKHLSYSVRQIFWYV